MSWSTSHVSISPVPHFLPSVPLSPPTRANQRPKYDCDRTSTASAPELSAGEPTGAGSHAAPPGLSGGVFWGEPARCCLRLFRSTILSASQSAESSSSSLISADTGLKRSPLVGCGSRGASSDPSLAPPGREPAVSTVARCVTRRRLTSPLGSNSRIAGMRLPT